MRPGDLTPERWSRIDAILDEALDLPPEARSSFLEQACEGDPYLRSQVEAFLEAEAAAAEFFKHAKETAVSTFADAVVSTVPERGEDGEMSVGPFRTIREVGRGGMGVVYLAEDTRLGRTVALKLLAPHLSLSSEPARLFTSEARAVAALDHPNVATLYETDVTEEGQLYMAFAYYEGATLGQHLDDGPISWLDTAEILRGIASGLAAAHGKGIVHGDVKPSNVILTGEGEVKLLDFGVATMVRASGAEVGPLMGTAAYMSPERIDAGPVDHRSDLWSLGVVLYEMLAGHRPFSGHSTESVLEAVRCQSPPPLEVGSDDGARGLAKIAERLLRKDPAERYASAEGLLADLDQVGPSGRRPTRLRTAAILMGALVGAVGIGSLAWPRLTSDPGDIQPTFAVSAVERLAVLPFEDLTGDSTSEALTTGVRSELVSALGSLTDVDVLSIPAMAEAVDAGLSGQEIARRFDVPAYVEAALSVASDSIVLTVSLVDVDSDRQFWGDTYRLDREALPRVAVEVASAISSRLDPESNGATTRRGANALASQRPRVDTQAYQAYLRGVFHLDRSSRESLELADRYLRRAIELDSSFAAAYANLAEARGRAAFFGLREPARTVPGVLELIERALAIDSTLALAHARLAPVLLFWERDPVAAERSARRAIELNPSAPEPYRTLSEILAAQGRHEEAMESALRAAALDPWSQFAAFRPGVIEGYAREFDAAIRRVEEGLRSFPEFWQGYWLLCMAHDGAGRAEEGVAACQEAVRRSGSTPMSIGGLGVAYARSGDRAAARRLAEELVGRSATEYVGPMYVAMIFAALDDRDQAFDWLDRAYREHDLMLVQLGNYAFFDSLREDPRFDELLSRMGLRDPHPRG